MKAIVIEAPHKVSLTEHPAPRPAEGQVLVRVSAVGMCMTDVDVLDGTLPEPYVKYPVIPGHEWSGTVVEVGAGVTRPKVGERVAVEGYNYCRTCFYCRRGETQLCTTYSQIGFNLPGGYSEYVAVRADLAHPFNENLPFESAALTEPGACVGHAFSRLNVKPGDTVVIVGPGTVGLLGILWARLFSPLQIIVVGLDRVNEPLARILGATEYITVKDNPVAYVRALTERLGADAVFEAAGNVEAVMLALNLARRGGSVALAGVSGNAHPLMLEPDSFLLNDLRVHGIFAYPSSTFVHTLRLIESRQIDVHPLITHTFPLENYAQAFDLLRTRREPLVKIILKP